MATDMIARALAAKAMQEAAGGGTEQFIVTVTDDKSDKTPAQIAEAVKAGKQVVLQDNSSDVVRFCYLVNAGNDVATFCGVIKKADGTAELDPIFGRVWFSILNDQTVIYNVDFNVPSFSIEKGDDGKYSSALGPQLLLDAAQMGCAGNASLGKDGKTFIGTISQESGDVLHIYFPDYAKGKVYDLKWNDDENPSTYTFTELSFGEGPMIVTFTVTDLSTFALKADTPYDDIKKAANAGRIVYAFVSAPVGPLFGQFSNAAGSNLLFSAYNNVGAIMIITMKSDSVIYGTGINPLYRLDDIVGGGDFNANNHRITGMAEPTDDSDAATKSYADKILTAGNNDSVIIKSSTPNSTKKFRITVDDAGAITATEVV